MKIDIIFRILCLILLLCMLLLLTKFDLLMPAAFQRNVQTSQGKHHNPDLHNCCLLLQRPSDWRGILLVTD